MKPLPRVTRFWYSMTPTWVCPIRSGTPAGSGEAGMRLPPLGGAALWRRAAGAGLSGGLVLAGRGMLFHPQGRSCVSVLMASSPVPLPRGRSAGPSGANCRTGYPAFPAVRTMWAVPGPPGKATTRSGLALCSIRSFRRNFQSLPGPSSFRSGGYGVQGMPRSRAYRPARVSAPVAFPWTIMAGFRRSRVSSRNFRSR